MFQGYVAVVSEKQKFSECGVERRGEETGRWGFLLVTPLFSTLVIAYVGDCVVVDKIIILALT